MEQPLECAIPQHMQVPRTQPAQMPKDYIPPYPAYCPRFPKTIENITMAIIGVQSGANETLELKDLDPVLGFVKDKTIGSAQPSFWDIASVRDNAQAHNLTVIVYWPSRAAYEEWGSNSGFEDWWNKLDPKQESHGWFLEVFIPAADSFETIFSDAAVLEGAARMCESVSGPVQEHVFWGSMRDRLPISQTDPLDGASPAPNGDPSTSDTKPEERRIKVPGRKNLCVIRSGQDWSTTTDYERKLYLETMHPVLIRGMDFLRDHGEEVGCLECRFMQVHDEAQGLAKSTDRTFGLAYTKDVASLEYWAKDHKTHLDIFGGFLRYAKELNNELSLKLFHEVLVLRPDQQRFEYVGCHAGTGMLSAPQ